MKIYAALLFALISLTTTAQRRNTLSLSLSPQDFGIGFRYDRIFKYGNGFYTSVSYGNYRLEFDGYIKNHVKIAAGATFKISRNYTRISAGLIYHSYGEQYLTTCAANNALTPLSIEFGMTARLGRLRPGFRFDPLKWEGLFEIGFNF